jgi:hypothetical protein
MAFSRNYCCNGKATKSPLCTAELHVSVNNIKILSVAQQCLYEEFISPATIWNPQVHYHVHNRAVLWLRWLVAGLSTRRPGFDPRSVHVGFVVDKVALGQVFLRVVGFLLSISFHWYSINCKNLVKKLLIHLSSSLGLHKKP